MADTSLKPNTMSVIPDDPEQSVYRFILVAAKRARQLQNGARSFLPSTSKKPTVMAVEEVRRGLVQYDDPALYHYATDAADKLAAQAAAADKKK